MDEVRGSVDLLGQFERRVTATSQSRTQNRHDTDNSITIKININKTIKIEKLQDTPMFQFSRNHDCNKIKTRSSPVTVLSVVITAVPCMSVANPHPQ